MAPSASVCIPFILQAGAVVMLFFVILAGVNYTVPLNEIFFLSADISSFHTAIDSPSGYGQWTLWGVCGATTDGKNVNCMEHVAAYPFSPADNFGDNNVPVYFVDNENFFYYTSRFMFAFFLIAITFSVVSVFAGFFAFCSRLGSAISSVFSAAASVFAVIAASLMTAVFVRGRDEFHDSGISASLGVKAFALTWTSVACLMLTTIGFCCVACGRGRRSRDYSSSRTSRFWRRRNRKSEADGVPATY